MLVAQAHSFKQQARLAITLAWVAGYTNIITIITCGTVTSHVSGTASNLGYFVTEGRWALAWFSLFLLVAFLVGAMLSGVCTELGRRLGWNSIYVLPIALEAVLLALFAAGLQLHDHGERQAGFALYWLTGVASLAMGVQNATITRISSGVVRTTHITGVLTDLGLEVVSIGLWLFDRKRNTNPHARRPSLHGPNTPASAQRVVLLASIVGTFALGAALGALAHDHVERSAMFPPVLFLVWIIYRDVSRPIATIHPFNLSDGNTIIQLPATVAIYHLREEKTRRGTIHRMPNLQIWADRLPAATRVVVFDLGQKTTFDANAALELRAVIAHFAAHGKRMVIAGLDTQQIQQIRRLGTSDLLDPNNCCPDLELAIARAMVLAE